MNENNLNYKDTLNLPQTDFPMKANLATREPEILAKWATLDIYNTLRAARQGKKKFVLHMGPPYANGHIHLGTATTTILKDMIVKANTMNGHDAPLVPGWDCHGLPIELNVEKKIGKPGHKVSASEFRVACREYANSFIDIQRQEFKRLGIIADWENPYLTMNFTYEANIIRSLAKIIDKKHLQKGHKPVHWCLDCASALAEAEVEYADKTSPSIDVRFFVCDETDVIKRFAIEKAGAGRIAVIIWTTTPWTLPANQAVAINASLDYVLVELNDEEQIIVANDLLESLLTRYDVKSHRVLAKMAGEKLVGMQLTHPFYERNVPVIASEHVTVESGTGAVHTAPAHGEEDYAVARQYDLPLDNPVGDDGCYISTTPMFAGMHVSKVNDQVIETLKSAGTLLKLGKITHSYPHCWRHKTPLIFRATPQWFISMDAHALREHALHAIHNVQWIPDWGQSRIESMIKNRPDWCISRQRAWGVPLALFIHKETGELHPKSLSLMEEVAKRVEKQGIEAWYALDTKELLGEEATHYSKTNDVLDVWFDSGVTHECVLRVRPELHFPADIVLEGSDQHRGWFQSSLLTSVAINEAASYKSVLTHGFVVDGQGRKMSKSLGNVIAPEEVIKTLGADILRLWVASIDYRYEISASKEILSRTSEAYRRIRNTARFLLANLNGFDPAKHLVAPDEMLILDRWAVDKAYRTQQDIIDAYHTYQFHIVVQKLHQFCLSDLGAFYLDIIKDRQYTMGADSRGRRSAQTALYHIAHAFVRWMTPIMSFTAEEIWQYLPGKEADSVMLATWYEALAPLSDDEIMNDAYWEKIRAVRDAVNKEIENQRNAGKIGSALEAKVTLYCGPQLLKQLTYLGDELRFVLITSAAEVIPEHNGPVDTMVTEVPGLSLVVEPIQHEKCVRCWHRRSDVNEYEAYPGLCGRCVENVALNGEIRKYA